MVSILEYFIKTFKNKIYILIQASIPILSPKGMQKNTADERKTGRHKWI